MNRAELNIMKKSYEERNSGYSHEICVCGGTSCDSSDSEEVYQEIQKEVVRLHLEHMVKVTRTGCFGLCSRGPIVTVYPEQITYEHVEPINAEEIIDEHILKHGYAAHFLSRAADPERGPFPVLLKDSAFTREQSRKIMALNGKIHSDSLEAYVGHDGFSGLQKALEMKPEDIIREIEKCNLRGRGGAGFQTAEKWRIAAKIPAAEKYLIANADEGDLGAYADRSLIEGNPYLLLEGMMIAGYAIGAEKSYIYTRREYTGAVEKLSEAIQKLSACGMLGKNILDTDFSFEIELRYNPGAYICGEETALIGTFTQGRGEPTVKNPYPVIAGLNHSPTVVNNVETLCNIPGIIREGSKAYRPTKVIALGGDIKNDGIVEVSAEMTLQDIIWKIGGGIKDGKDLKAVLTGGASGSCIRKDELNITMDYASFCKRHLQMGGGVLTILSESNCIVDQMKSLTAFSMEESCGKCTACRIGTRKMHEILEKITDGTAEMKDLDKLKELAEYVAESSSCGLGKGSARPVLESLEKFRSEYEAHINDRKCPALVCRELVDYFVDKEICEGCGVCAVLCPAHCITEDVSEKKCIDNDRCVACDTCMNMCPAEAITKH